MSNGNPIFDIYQGRSMSDAQDRIQHREQWDRMERAEADVEALATAARLAHSTLQRVCGATSSGHTFGCGSPLHFDCIAARDQLQAALAKTET